MVPNKERILLQPPVYSKRSATRLLVTSVSTSSSWGGGLFILAINKWYQISTYINNIGYKVGKKTITQSYPISYHSLHIRPSRNPGRCATGSFGKTDVGAQSQARGLAGGDEFPKSFHLLLAPATNVEGVGRSLSHKSNYTKKNLLMMIENEGCIFSFFGDCATREGNCKKLCNGLCVGTTQSAYG